MPDWTIILWILGVVVCIALAPNEWFGIVVIAFFLYLFVNADALAHPHGWGWSEREPGWRVVRDGLHGEPRLEKASYDIDARLMLSRRCMGFALPPDALPFLGNAAVVSVRWRVDNRKVRYGMFSLYPTRNGVELCAADTVVKDWEKRFAKDVLGIDDDVFMANAPVVLTVQFQGGDSGSPGNAVEGNFNLDGVRGVACRHRALPNKRLRACGGEHR